jgi:hypothetical protein
LAHERQLPSGDRRKGSASQPPEFPAGGPDRKGGGSKSDGDQPALTPTVTHLKNISGPTKAIIPRNNMEGKGREDGEGKGSFYKRIWETGS